MAFEVVDFVQTTRRWHDKGNLRDAGEWYACQMLKLNKKSVHSERFSYTNNALETQSRHHPKRVRLWSRAGHQRFNPDEQYNVG